MESNIERIQTVGPSLQILQMSGPVLDKLLRRLASSMANYYVQTCSLTLLGSLYVQYVHRKVKARP